MIKRSVRSKLDYEDKTFVFSAHSKDSIGITNKQPYYCFDIHRASL